MTSFLLVSQKPPHVPSQKHQGDLFPREIDLPYETIVSPDTRPLRFTTVKSFLLLVLLLRFQLL